MIVTCPGCGKSNKLPDSPRTDGIYRCGSCGGPLKWLNDATSDGPTPQAPLFGTDLSPELLAARLENARRELLDLSLRNRLLHCPKPRSKGLQLVNEKSGELYRVLVQEGRKMSFLPSQAETIADGAEQADLFDRTEAEENEAERHSDSRLQTELRADRLQRRLLAIYYAARTLLEEQGVNTLFLALGFLYWRESNESTEDRRAPLVLVPVTLERTSVRARFRVAYNGEDLRPNVSLEEKLRAEFGVTLPEFPDTDSFKPETYCDGVKAAVSGRQGSRVQIDEIQLGFFSFSKLVMYHDLSALSWPDDSPPSQHAILRRLLGEGFGNEPTFCSHDAFVDPYVDRTKPAHVLDADSSQTAALLEALDGRTMTIQGPPGTGKSQTIGNLIAQSVAEGKTVLFVAEKMAALNAVKKYMDKVGLGDLCLELHSNKTSKKAILAELDRTLQLGRPRTQRSEDELHLLEGVRTRLESYCTAVNREIGESGLTPRAVFGDLMRLQESLASEGALPKLLLPGADSWTRMEFERRKGLVEELEARLSGCGVPRNHAFWGSCLTLYVATNRLHLEEQLQGAVAHSRRLGAAARSFSAQLEVSPLDSSSAVEEAIAAVREISRAPNLEGSSPNRSDWLEKSSHIKELVETGQRLSSIHSTYEAVIVPEAFSEQVQSIRTNLRNYGPKWWRFFSGHWRTSQRRLRMICRERPPKSFLKQLEIMEAIQEYQRLRGGLEKQRDLLDRLFSSNSEWTRVDWDLREHQARWLTEAARKVADGNLPAWTLEIAADRERVERFREIINEAAEALSAERKTVERLKNLLKLNEQRFDEGPLSQQSFGIVRDRWLGMLNGIAKLPALVAYNQKAEELKAEGLETVLQVAESWNRGSRALTALFNLEHRRELTRRAFEERPELARFQRDEHDRVVEKFRELDRLQLETSRRRVALAHWKGVPRAAAAGRMLVLTNEIAKKRRHLPIRRLIEQAGNPIQAIKPVFLMSPLSVAQFLSPAAVQFDLVVFDEASQVKPVDAYGSILRGKQAVVVGDSKQLPPTDFFERLAGDDVTEDEEVERASVSVDLESILSQFEALRAPSRMLRWHYRSQHESLIAFSNSEFYDSKLVTFPSPWRESETLGLRLHHLSETTYDRGGSRINRREAEIVGNAVMEHARRQIKYAPENWETLLVASFSASQRDAILDRLELLRRADPSCEEFFSDRRLEPFEVKNLENVQGDERDIILISVGYGRDAQRHISMHFGPLNKEGGERRLNVLCTRARRRCEVFTNLKAEDIRTLERSPRGVLAFKNFLHYAATRALRAPGPSMGEPESEFEEQVRLRLVERGHVVDCQVGDCGFRIDLAVAHRNRPGRYVLGVECDGAAYHSARSSRDRDRLRQEVLERRGWRIHRIWSTAWFQNQEAELRRLLEVIEEETNKFGAGVAIGRGSQGKTSKDSSARVLSFPPPVIPRDKKPSGNRSDDAVIPYRVARLNARLQPGQQLHEVPSWKLAQWLAAVVRVEEPVHSQEAARRVANAVGVARLGSRITTAFESAIRYAERQGVLRRTGDFLWQKGTTDPPLRDRSDVEGSLRRIEFVCSEEIDLAILRAVSDSHGIDREELPGEVCRLIGLGRTGSEIRKCVADRARALLRRGRLRREGCYFEAVS